MSEYTITLADGVEIEANLNMNTWESDVEIPDTIFANNTSNVSYTTPEGKKVELGECKYIKGAHIDDVYMFFLNPLTEEEKAQKQMAQNTADISYIMIMEDL